MNFFDRFIPGNKEQANPEVEGGAVSTAEDLSRLAESNEVVEAELQNFSDQIEHLKEQAQIGGGMTPADWNLVTQKAKRSAEALNGYGISVAPEAFEEMAR